LNSLEAVRSLVQEYLIALDELSVPSGRRDAIRSLVVQDLMILDELSIPSGRREAIKRLATGGWRKLGKGAFTDVKHHPKRDHILKLYNTKDKSYDRFLELAAQRQDDPHFPKLHRERGRVQVSKNYSAVRMEKLTPYDIKNNEHYSMHHIATDYMQDLHANHKRSLLPPEDKWRVPAPSRFRMEDTEIKHPEMARALRDIHEHVVIPTGSRIDLHPGNLMFRVSHDTGKHQIVFTDPAAFGHVAPHGSPIPKSSYKSSPEEDEHTEDSHEATELKMHADNHEKLYRHSYTPTMNHLLQDMKKGVYDHSKAKNMWGFHADRAAQAYHKEFGDKDQKWHEMFPTSARKHAAKAWADEAHEMLKSGEYSHTED
jgi:hypothetical protein